MNDLYLFAEVVRHGGFSAASRALRVPKSRLSRRIANLEDRLNLRLLQRSERSFSVTPAGRIFHHHCQAVVEQVEAAESVLAEMRGKARGVVRVSCPVTLAQYVLAPILPRFLIENAEVELALSYTNRTVNVIADGYDVALSVHRAPLRTKSIVARRIGWSRQILVAAPRLFEASVRPKVPKDLFALPSLIGGEGTGADEWELIAADQTKVTIPLAPRLISECLQVLKQAALAGAGVVRLPFVMCRDELDAGVLEAVLPEWSMQSHEIHILYPTRKGITPAIRSFVEFVMGETAAQFRPGKRWVLAARPQPM